MKPEEIKSAVQTQVDDAVTATFAKVDSGDITSVEDAVKDICDTLEGQEGESNENKPEGSTSKLGGLGMGNEGGMELGEGK